MDIRFFFAFGDKVKVARSGEVGEVVAASVSARLTHQQFLVEYVSADHRATENWFYQSELEPA